MSTNQQQSGETANTYTLSILLLALWVALIHHVAVRTLLLSYIPPSYLTWATTIAISAAVGLELANIKVQAFLFESVIFDWAKAKAKDRLGKTVMALIAFFCFASGYIYLGWYAPEIATDLKYQDVYEVVAAENISGTMAVNLEKKLEQLEERRTKAHEKNVSSQKKNRAKHPEWRRDYDNQEAAKRRDIDKEFDKNVSEATASASAIILATTESASRSDSLANARIEKKNARNEELRAKESGAIKGLSIILWLGGFCLAFMRHSIAGVQKSAVDEVFSGAVLFLGSAWVRMVAVFMHWVGYGLNSIPMPEQTKAHRVPQGSFTNSINLADSLAKSKQSLATAKSRLRAAETAGDIELAENNRKLIEGHLSKIAILEELLRSQ